MAKGDLTAARLRELMDYDPETGVLTWKADAQHLKAGTKAGSYKPTTGYIVVCVDERRYVAHRLAWLWVHGEWPQGQIDHINRIKTDNRLANLRDVDASLNQHNQVQARTTNHLGVRGVSQQKNRFRARIYHDGKSRLIGSFLSLEAAQQAYLAEKRRLGALE